MKSTLTALGTVLLVLLGVTVVATPTAQAASRGVRITAIYFDSPGPDRGGNRSLNAEWVQLKNTSGSRKTLTGWTLRDAASHVYHFPRFRLAAGASVKVHTGSGTNTRHNLYWGSGRYIWNNDGDTARLKNARGTLVDRCSYTEASDPEAFC